MKAEIFNIKKWIIGCDPNYLKYIINEMLEKTEFSILNFNEYYFKNYGYTALWLLGESHLAIHTFPEENKTYLELSSCNEKKNNKFLDLLKDSSLKVENNK